MVCTSIKKVWHASAGLRQALTKKVNVGAWLCGISAAPSPGSARITPFKNLTPVGTSLNASIKQPRVISATGCICRNCAPSKHFVENPHHTMHIPIGTSSVLRSTRLRLHASAPDYDAVSRVVELSVMSQKKRHDAHRHIQAPQQLLHMR